MSYKGYPGISAGQSMDSITGIKRLDQDVFLALLDFGANSQT